MQRDRQELIRPLVISHGANSPRTDRSRFQLEFAWTGTGDPSAALSVPASLRYLETLVDGGWPALMQRNKRLALAARELICECLEVATPCPNTMIGCMASVPLPCATTLRCNERLLEPLSEALFQDFAIEVPVMRWPPPCQSPVTHLGTDLQRHIPISAIVRGADDLALNAGFILLRHRQLGFEFQQTRHVRANSLL